MEDKNKNISTDAEKCAELISDLKKDAQLYSYISVAMKSYVDGIKAALNCKNFAQTQN